MEARFEVRKEELLDECKLPPQTFRDMTPRLERFMEPFTESLTREEQYAHARTYVCGLLSDLDHKNVESIAYRFGQGRMGLQRFVGFSNWDESPLIDELIRQVSKELAESDAVIVFDPSAFPKSGKESVGVTRQWCGRLGKIDNCQVGVFMGYVSRKEHALVDTRIYLPKEWTKDRKRCRKAGVPSRVRYRTRHQLCLEMLKKHGPRLPHAWITGDDEMGRSYAFRRDLQELEEQYLLAVPSNTLIRDLEVPLPEYCGTGRKPNRPWQRVDRWDASMPAEKWTRIDVRDGAKGPLIVEATAQRVFARASQRREGHEEILVIFRYRDRDNRQIVKTDYYLSNASIETPLSEFARAAKAEHRIEECLQRSKSEAGLADYEVRSWTGWQHHQTLSLIATWFLLKETRRGKKMDACDHAATNPRRHLGPTSPRVRMRHTVAHPTRTRTAISSKRTGAPLPLETT